MFAAQVAVGSINGGQRSFLAVLHYKLVLEVISENQIWKNAGV